MKRLIVLLALLALAFATPASGAVKKGDAGLGWLIGGTAAQIYTGLSTDTKPTSASFKYLVVGAAFIETDTQKIYLYNGTAWVLKQTRKVKAAVDTLTAPGNFPAVSTAGYTHATFIFSDSLVATSATVQFQGKIDNLAPLDYFVLDAESDSTVFAGANGTWARTFTLAGGMDWVRLKVLSEAGGVAGKFWSCIVLWNPVK
jgi:hypothetical protein